MTRQMMVLTTAAVMAVLGAQPTSAQDRAKRASMIRHPLLISRNAPRYPIWYFDGRDDDRDFQTNGVFPGDFAADPANAAFDATSLFSRIRTYIDPDCAAPAAVRALRGRTGCTPRARSDVADRR